MSPASLNEMESKMRDEIRKLQERRVGVLMDEVMQLQNEKESLLSKVNSLENENQQLKQQNATLKATEKLSVQIAVLEKALQQEKDENNKLKQRLRVAKRRNSGLTVDTQNLDREKSSSMNDMANQHPTTSIKDKRLELKTFMANTPSPRTKRYVLAATSTKDASTQTTNSEGDVVVPITRDAAAENDEDKKITVLNGDMKAALSEAKTTILEILHEKEVP